MLFSCKRGNTTTGDLQVHEAFYQGIIGLRLAYVFLSKVSHFPPKLRHLNSVSSEMQSSLILKLITIKWMMRLRCSDYAAQILLR